MKLSTEHVRSFIPDDVYASTEKEVLAAFKSLHDGSIQGADFLGWLPGNPLTDATLEAIQAKAKELQDAIDVLVVIGIGGSYLGAQAAMDALSPYFNDDSVEVIFAGHHLSAAYLEELTHYLKSKRFAINVISNPGRPRNRRLLSVF